MMLGNILGLPIKTINDSMFPGGDYVQIRTHKKKRINKKYLKKYGKVYRAPMVVYMDDSTGSTVFYCPESRIKSLLNKSISSDGSASSIPVKIMCFDMYRNLKTKR